MATKPIESATVPSGTTDNRPTPQPTVVTTVDNAPHALTSMLKPDGDLDANLVAKLKLESPRSMLSNGLKSLQEFLLGHRLKVDGSELITLKLIHSKLRTIGKTDSVNAVERADYADLTKSTRVMDDIKHTGTRTDIVKCTTDIGWSPE
jgi:hypothetical protein